MVRPLFLWDHGLPERGGQGQGQGPGQGAHSDPGGRSRCNPGEAELVVAQARYLLQQGYRAGGWGGD